MHALFDLDDEKYAEEFNSVGKKVQEAAREYEDRLCANTERGMYNKYSTSLAEKFQEEIRKVFPLYDHIGIIAINEPKFTLKKISV